MVVGLSSTSWDSDFLDHILYFLRWCRSNFGYCKTHYEVEKHPQRTNSLRRYSKPPMCCGIQFRIDEFEINDVGQSETKPEIIPTIAPSLLIRVEKMPMIITGKKDAAAKPKAKATTSATKPGGLIPK